MVEFGKKRVMVEFGKKRVMVEFGKKRIAYKRALRSDSKVACSWPFTMSVHITPPPHEQQSAGH